MALLTLPAWWAGRFFGGAWRAVLSRASRLGWLLALVNMALAAAPSMVPAAKAPEYAIKAAYLFNFTHFVEWPSNAFASAAAPLVIGVLGDDPFGAALDQAVKDRTAQGRALQIRRIKQIGEVGGCHILFVCASESKRLPEVLAAAHQRNVLSVSDLDRFAEQGGVISFYTENNKVRFRINLSAAERAGTRISSQLLRLGTIIRDKDTAER
jgi:hypothetical protein